MAAVEQESRPTCGSSAAPHAGEEDAAPLPTSDRANGDSDFFGRPTGQGFDEDERENFEHLQYMVRNTFIEVGGPSSASCKQREVQSCPTTSLLPSAVLRPGMSAGAVGLPGLLDEQFSAPDFDFVAAAVAAASSPSTTPQLRPCSPGMGATLRAEPRQSPAASAAMKLSPALPALQRQSPSAAAAAKLSPALPTLCGSPEIAAHVPWDRDLVAELVANAAAAVEASTPTLAKAEVVSPDQPTHTWQRTPSSTSTPAPAEPRALGPGVLADPVAAAVAVAASAGHCNAEEQRRKTPTHSEGLRPGTSPLNSDSGIGAGLSSPDKFSMMPNSTWRPLLEDLVESDDEMETPEMDSAFDVLLDDGSDEHEHPSKAKRAASSSQAKPARGAAQRAFHQAKAATAAMGGGGVGEGFGTNGTGGSGGGRGRSAKEEGDAHVQEQRIKEFVQRWGLDSRCLSVIQQLEREDLDEVISDFDASTGTKNVSAKFMVWMDSRLRRAEARRQRLLPPPQPPSEDELSDFFSRWSLDRRSQRYVHALPPTIQSALLEQFNPPADTRNMDAKLVAFVKLQLNKESAKCLRLGGASMSSSGVASGGGAAPTGGKGFAGAQQPQQRRRSSQQQEYPQRPNGEDMLDAAGRFASLWGLDASAEEMLRTLPFHSQQTVILNFRASGNKNDINRKFAQFLRPYLSESYIAPVAGCGGHAPIFLPAQMPGGCMSANSASGSASAAGGKGGQNLRRRDGAAQQSPKAPWPAPTGMYPQRHSASIAAPVFAGAPAVNVAALQAAQANMAAAQANMAAAAAAGYMMPPWVYPGYVDPYLLQHAYPGGTAEQPDEEP